MLSSYSVSVPLDQKSICPTARQKTLFLHVCCPYYLNAGLEFGYIVGLWRKKHLLITAGLEDFWCKFLDNRLSEKCAVGPEGHFSDYWGFGITVCRKTIEWLWPPSSVDFVAPHYFLPVLPLGRTHNCNRGYRALSLRRKHMTFFWALAETTDGVIFLWGDSVTVLLRWRDFTRVIFTLHHLYFWGSLFWRWKKGGVILFYILSLSLVSLALSFAYQC